MPEFLGRKIAFTWNGSAIDGVREKGIALNGEAIDVSSDESNGFRFLLDESGEDTFDISISGVTKVHTLMVDFFGGNRTRAVTITYPDGRIIAGNFRLVTYTDTGPYKEATTFEAELQSTGVITHTPPA